MLKYIFYEIIKVKLICIFDGFKLKYNSENNKFKCNYF